MKMRVLIGVVGLSSLLLAPLLGIAEEQQMSCSKEEKCLIDCDMNGENCEYGYQAYALDAKGNKVKAGCVNEYICKLLER